jgi:hypothetical protein
MSIREDIAANIVTVLTNMSSPITLKKVTRDPFDYERLSNAQFPSAWVQSGEETREDISSGVTIRRMGSITYRIIGFVKGGSLDTARNEMIEAIEEALDLDRTRGGGALSTQVTSVGTDEGTLEPVGGITMDVAVTYVYSKGTT